MLYFSTNINKNLKFILIKKFIDTANPLGSATGRTPWVATLPGRSGL